MTLCVCVCVCVCTCACALSIIMQLAYHMKKNVDKYEKKSQLSRL